MNRNKQIIGSVLAVSLLIAASATVSAMPADIEEAVTSPDYHSYEHIGGSAYYDEADLIALNGTYMATGNAMIRESPFGEILGNVVTGQTYQVIGECPDCMWYKISGDLTGYVYAGYLVPEEEYEEDGSNIRTLDMKMLVSGAASVNVRTAPSKSGSISYVVNEGDEIHVVGNVLGTDWYLCDYNNDIVYINDNYLKPELPQTMVCEAGSLNIREKADGTSRIIGTLKKGDKVKVSADEKDWLRFSLPDGTIGYVYDEYMAAI